MKSFWTSTIRSASAMPFVARAASRAQLEGRVAVGDEDQRVADDAVVPPEHALDVVEYRARIAAAEEDRKPRPDDGEERYDVQEEEHDVVRNGKQPLHERQPPVQLPRVGVLDVQADGLLLLGGGVAVVHEGEVDADSVGE